MRNLIWVFLVFSLQLKSQSLSYLKIDKHTDTITEKDFKNIKSLTHRLIKPAKTDTEKVRAIYYWLANNIKFSKCSYNDNYWSDFKDGKEIAELTFNLKTGMCRGYASLLKIMLDEIKIENVLIKGHLKMLRFREDTILTNHIWNAVKLNNQWLPLDLALSAPRTTSKFDEFYFLTDPSRFILSHYPSDTKWTLVKDSIDFEKYRKIPYCSQNYFELGFGPTIPLVEKFKNKVVFKVQKPNNVSLGLILKNRANYEEIYHNALKISNEGSFSIIEFPITQKGKFEVELIARNKGVVYFYIAATDFDNL